MIDPLLRKLFARAAELGLSDRELGRRAGISHSIVSYYHTGQRQPSISRVHALARALGYTIILTRTP